MTEVCASHHANIPTRSKHYLVKWVFIRALLLLPFKSETPPQAPVWGTCPQAVANVWRRLWGPSWLWIDAGRSRPLEIIYISMGCWWLLYVTLHFHHALCFLVSTGGNYLRYMLLLWRIELPDCEGVKPLRSWGRTHCSLQLFARSFGHGNKHVTSKGVAFIVLNAHMETCPHLHGAGLYHSRLYLHSY